MRFVDTHCHINDQRAFPDPSEAVRLAQEAGVANLVVVGVDVESSARAVGLAETLPGVHAVVGWHPTHTAQMGPEDLEPIRDMLAHPKVVAIGEIGLDYHWDHSTPQQQHRALHLQLDLAAELAVPIVFHCREAYPDLLEILEARGPGEYLFHCFAGDEADARRAVELGAIFGVDGPVTYPKAEPLRQTLRTVGIDRIVLETDSPYMPPAPFRGKPNAPHNIPLIAEGLATALGIHLEEVWEKTTANAARFFKRDF